jgi:hypothetical protein
MNEDPLFQPDQISPADREIKIIDLQAEPYQDLRRVKVTFRLPYFQEAVNAAITLSGTDGEAITSVDVVNLIQSENEVTLHFPGSKAQAGDYQVDLVLFQIIETDIQQEKNGDIQLITKNLKTRKVSFSIP